ncbi:MAG: sialate O-acetylesterase [Planctomycetaceae bacterium]|nr:sialate O-acetylesterase [Planctomycetaceae bacterium]
MRLLSCLVLTVCMLPAAVGADLELPSVFADTMVLQRGVPVRVWGWANAGDEVTVAIAGQTQSAMVGADGLWKVMLSPLSVGGPHELTVSCGEQKLTKRDVLIGDVWLCSGQSNMAMTVNRAANFEAEAAAADFPRLRMFKVDSAHNTEPQERCRGTWTVCSPDTVGSFSATAYFFGRRLHQELDVPIGLINSSVGGTSIESWTSMSAQSAVEAIQPRLEAWQQDDADFNADKAQANYERALEQWKDRAAKAKEAGKAAPRRPQLAVQPSTDRNYPSNLFNGKINPLVGYTIKGAIWYQGENAAGRGFAHLYGHQLRTLISDWRTRWEQGNFPFAWVQLPNFRAPQEQPSEMTGWVQVREGMLQSLGMPHTGMAVTIDVGEANDIHPKDKQTVGHRLAQWALGDVYSKSVIPMGPIYDRHETRDDDVVIHFRYADGLTAHDGKVAGFAVAGPDQKFVAADARIEGSRVVVRHPDGTKPAAVRYAWADNPVFSLINSAGIPASPFRTDNWKE